MDGVGFKTLVANDYLLEPQCAYHWPRGTQEYTGPYQASVLVQKHVQHHGRICAILSGLLANKNRPHEENRSTAANAISKEKIATDY